MRITLTTRARAVVAAAALLAGVAIPAAASPASAAPAANTRHAVTAAAAGAAATAVPRYDHVAVIMDNSHDYASILHNRFAPTINRLAKAYGLASNYFTTSDPDVADIMDLLAGNNFGVGNGSPYWDQQTRDSSLLSQLDQAHKSWKEYVQNLPYPGYLGDCYPGNCLQTDSLYNQIQFNSLPDLASVADNPAEARKMVPDSELATDSHSGRLPAFSFIVGNECTNMHGGPPWCEDSSSFYHQPDDNKLVAAGDSYIAKVTREIMSGPQWRHGNNAIVVSFTEGDTKAGCCGVNPGTGHVMTIVITSHGPRHLVDPTPFNHYSLLLTIEDAFGLHCLRHACDKGLVAMAKLFGAKSDPAGGPNPAPAGRTEALPAIPARPAPKAAVGAAPASPWTVVTSPDTGSNDNDLAAISAGSPTDIWAVGGLLPTANATVVHTLAVHYNGTTWSIVPTPNVGQEANSLYGVAALPDGTAWATGIYTPASGHTGQALTEHWNGHKWSIVSAPSPGAQDNMLYGVTAVSDSDVWAVGGASGTDGFFHPLIEHWNGHRWEVGHIRGLRADGILTSVSSAPGEGVWATGQLVDQAPDRQLIVHLVHGSWVVSSIRAVRSSGGAAASAYPEAIAVSPQGTWVAGNERAGQAGFSTLVEAPGSGGGTELKTPNPTPRDNYLSGIAPVLDGTDAWAVGYSLSVSTGNVSSLIEFGSASGGWKIVPSPDPGAPNGNTFIDAVLALSNHNIWAVGTYDGQSGERTLIMHDTGGA